MDFIEIVISVNSLSVFSYEDSGDTVATISATRIFIIQLCAGMKKAHEVMVMSLFISMKI